MTKALLDLDVKAIDADPFFYKKIEWVLENFKAMGATQEQLLFEEKKMFENIEYLNKNLDLLDFEMNYINFKTNFLE